MLWCSVLGRMRQRHVRCLVTWMSSEFICKKSHASNDGQKLFPSKSGEVSIAEEFLLKLLLFSCVGSRISEIYFSRWNDFINPSSNEDCPTPVGILQNHWSVYEPNLSYHQAAQRGIHQKFPPQISPHFWCYPSKGSKGPRPGPKKINDPARHWDALEAPSGEAAPPTHRVPARGVRSEFFDPSSLDANIFLFFFLFGGVIIMFSHFFGGVTF